MVKFFVGGIIVIADYFIVEDTAILFFANGYPHCPVGRAKKGTKVWVESPETITEIISKEAFAQVDAMKREMTSLLAIYERMQAAMEKTGLAPGQTVRPLEDSRELKVIKRQYNDLIRAIDDISHRLHNGTPLR